MGKKIIGLALCLAIVLIMVPVNMVNAADATTSVTIIKYDTDGTTILDQTTVTWEWMKDNLPVQGNGVTHYYHQGPTFDDSTFEKIWDPGETVNIDSRDCGAAMGTDVKDLCNLVGGASSGDTIRIRASDNFAKWFDYEDVYSPEPEQGKMVVTWYTADTGEGPDGYVPDYTSGMRLVFFAETLSSDDKHVFGNWDMHETLAESRWHYYYDGEFWPSSSGLAVKYVRYIEIYTGGSGEDRASDSLIATATVILGSVGISLDRDSIDFGNIRPGNDSAIETVGITNIGSVDCDVTMEVQSDDNTALSFYEQSLYINNHIYNVDDIIASILIGETAQVNTQLKVPATWNDAGEQQATFIFWATASE
jgi:hypothetical protein